MELFFLQDIFIADKINKKTQQCIAAAGCCIPECLQVHQPAERRIKKINNGQDKISCCINMPFHAIVKNTSLWFIPKPSGLSGRVSVNSQQNYR
jgi:hypothetical protein